MVKKKKTQRSKFKRPENVDHFIAVWGMMDDIIHNTKRKTAISFWKTFGIPLLDFGKNFEFLDGRKVTYDDIIVNRYCYYSLFKRDSYDRIYGIFLDALSMEV